MKVLLINPPVEDFFFTPQRAYPLGILSLATVLEQAGVTVKVLNCLQDYKKRTLAVPKQFSYLKRYYKENKSPFCLFSRYWRFGIDDSGIVNSVKNFSPDIVGISANFSAYFKSALQTAKLIKDIDKRIMLVMGGRVPTAVPRLALSDKNIDFAVRGEAEHVFLKLCQALSQGKKISGKGICCRTAGNKIIVSKEIPLIKDLNCLPILNRRLIDYHKYFFKGNTFTSLLASRGCNMRCGFCSIRERFRYRRTEHIINEITDCYALGIRHFNFEDDTMNLHPEFEGLLDNLIEKYKGKIKISFMNGLLTLNLNKRMREKLIDAGLTHIDLSVASADKRLRTKMNRQEDIRQVFNLAGYMTNRGISATVHFIIGYPGQNFKSAVKDLKILADKPAFLGPSVFYPVIESPVFDILEKKYRITGQDYEFFRSSVAFFDRDISRDRIFLLFYFSRIINFVKDLFSRYDIKNGNLKRFLESRLRNIPVRDDTDYYLEGKYDRITLGMIILRALMEKNVLYRVVEDAGKKDKIRYRFIKEEFIEEKDIAILISLLAG